MLLVHVFSCSRQETVAFILHPFRLFRNHRQAQIAGNHRKIRYRSVAGMPSNTNHCAEDWRAIDYTRPVTSIDLPNHTQSHLFHIDVLSWAGGFAGYLEPIFLTYKVKPFFFTYN